MSPCVPWEGYISDQGYGTVFIEAIAADRYRRIMVVK